MSQRNVAEQPLAFSPETSATASIGGGAARDRARPVEWHAGLRRSLLLGLLYALPGGLVLLSVATSYLNYDVWWHLRTAQWILQHHAVPRTDPFSAFGMGKPWAAYSWLFELVAYGFYRSFGLMGTVVFMAIMETAIGLAFYGAIRKRMGGLAGPIALTAAGLLILAQTDHVRPWLFSILFFVFEMDVLFGELVGEPKQQSPRRLWLLPPMFALWANLHIQFIYGLAVLGIAAVMQDLSAVPGANGPRIVTARDRSRRKLWLVTAASFLATFLNPYTWRIYGVVLGLARDTSVFDEITEFRAPSFRLPFDYLLILIVLGAAFVLGRAQLRGRLFAGILLLGTTMISLRALRDEWVVLVVASLIIAVGLRRQRASPVAIPRRQQLSAVVVAALLILVWGKRLGVSQKMLEYRAAAVFPIKAAAFAVQHGLRGPLFNSFNYGGYLTWATPGLPVSMDGRTNVYGGKRVEQNISTWKCLPGWRGDPILASANLVIGSATAPLSYALRYDPQFQLVYEDQTADVFVRKAQ